LLEVLLLSEPAPSVRVRGSSSRLSHYNHGPPSLPIFGLVEPSSGSRFHPPNKKFKSSLYSLNILSSVTSERWSNPRLCTTVHITNPHTQKKRIVGNVWEVCLVRNLNSIPPAPERFHSSRLSMLLYY